MSDELDLNKLIEDAHRKVEARHQSDAPAPKQVDAAPRHHFPKPEEQKKKKPDKRAADERTWPAIGFVGGGLASLALPGGLPVSLAMMAGGTGVGMVMDKMHIPAPSATLIGTTVVTTVAATTASLLGIVPLAPVVAAGLGAIAPPALKLGAELLETPMEWVGKALGALKTPVIAIGTAAVAYGLSKVGIMPEIAAGLAPEAVAAISGVASVVSQLGEHNRGKGYGWQIGAHGGAILGGIVALGHGLELMGEPILGFLTSMAVGTAAGGCVGSTVGGLADRVTAPFRSGVTNHDPERPREQSATRAPGEQIEGQEIQHHFPEQVRDAGEAKGSYAERIEKKPENYVDRLNTPSNTRNMGGRL